MNLREANQADILVIGEVLVNVPERYRELVIQFKCGRNGEMKEYVLVSGIWMVNDEAKSTVWQEWYCPTSGEAVMCPGPCPDGTPHIKIENDRA